MKRSVKSMTAVAMSAAMVMSMGMPAFASSANPTVTAPIYSFEVLDVVVPTTYEVAFNPEGLTVTTGTTTTSTDQILSRNYGMINKGNKDQIMTVSLTVEDKNTGDAKVVFVDDAAEVTNAADGEYKIHLMAIPADATEVQVGATPAAADKDTAASDLNNVTMTKAADAKAVTLAAGENKLGFKLDKATYAPIAGSEVTLGTSTDNDVADNYEITALAGAGKGITAFTFGGTMNQNANWSKLQSGIEITAVYTNAIAPSDATVIDGTGAMVELGPQVALSTDGKITVTKLDGTKWDSMVVNDGDKDWPMVTGTDGTWEWEDAVDGTKVFTLSEAWIKFLPGKTATVKVTLTDGTSITSAPVTFPAA